MTSSKNAMHKKVYIVDYERITPSYYNYGRVKECVHLTCSYHLNSNKS